MYLYNLQIKGDSHKKKFDGEKLSRSNESEKNDSSGSHIHFVDAAVY
jgi:hypothetical protein